MDGRDRDFSLAERWSDENVFANRAYFMPEKQPAELGVDHIRESDQGVYRCRVDFKVAQTRNSKVNLTVIGKFILNKSFKFVFPVSQNKQKQLIRIKVWKKGFVTNYLNRFVKN